MIAPHPRIRPKELAHVIALWASKWTARMRSLFRNAQATQGSLIESSGHIQIAVLLIFADSRSRLRPHGPIEVALVESFLLEAPLGRGDRG